VAIIIIAIVVVVALFFTGAFKAKNSSSTKRDLLPVSLFDSLSVRSVAGRYVLGQDADLTLAKRYVVWPDTTSAGNVDP
jgi:hypothetical protein